MHINMLYLKNYDDTGDIFQKYFLKYVPSSDLFENYEHKKLWFIRVTINEFKILIPLLNVSNKYRR